MSSLQQLINSVGRLRIPSESRGSYSELRTKRTSEVMAAIKVGWWIQEAIESYDSIEFAEPTSKLRGRH